MKSGAFLLKSASVNKYVARCMPAMLSDSKNRYSTVLIGNAVGMGVNDTLTDNGNVWSWMDGDLGQPRKYEWWITTMSGGFGSGLKNDLNNLNIAVEVSRS